MEDNLLVLFQMSDDILAAGVPGVKAYAFCPAVHSFIVRKQIVHHQQATPAACMTASLGEEYMHPGNKHQVNAY